ncbi:hypothetical protein [Flammeovirga aprica]|uniref:G8 domain-containing protein n=1 Tax=Flammeovirga aprica JL-4 TaxID=694437 RepID=A0A7X9P0C7_9BACT|nr:hypothetical protein [Flammeovirga aprica]NME67241.1 hypothetical protein [Flammeovirga aprica JL-4]
MMKTTTILFVLLLTTLYNYLNAEQYKPNGEITINTLEDWQNNGNWVTIAGGSGSPTNNDEIILSSNARLILNYDLKSDNINVYLTFEDDGFLQIQSNGALSVLGGVIMASNNVEMKVYGELEVEANFQLDNGNLFVKDGGSLNVQGDFLRSNIGSGQFEIGGDATSFIVGGDFDDQHNTPSVFNTPYINIGGSCSTKSGSFCDVYLPVTLISLSVSYDDGNALIQWSTASEQNNRVFEVYRSIDLKEWELIGNVEGQGNSHVTHHYQWLDPSPTRAGRTYYQLHQIDFDGQKEVFETLVLDSQNSSTLPKVMISTNSISSGQDIQILYRNEKSNSKKMMIVYPDGKVMDCAALNGDLLSNQLFSKGINILLISYGKEKYSFKILK